MSAAPIPPHDLDAERAVLSACLLHPEALDELGPLEESDLYHEPHRRLFRAVREVDEAGETVDAVTVAHALKSAGTYDRIGGAAFLNEVLDGSPEVANVGAHAQIVTGKARVRRVMGVCRELLAEGATTAADPSAWLVDAEARVFDACQTAEHRSNLSTMREMVTDTQAEITERQDNHSAPSGILTGFGGLDRRIGGLKRGNKYTLAAVPGAGKTALALQIAVNVAKSGTDDEPAGVVFVSLEMTRAELSYRALAQQSGVNEATIERGEPDAAQWSSLTGAVQRLSALPIVVDDTAGQTVGSVRSTVRRGLRKLQKLFPGVRLALIVIDHLHIQTPDAKRGASRNNELAQLSNGNRQLAKEFDCPVLELGHLNRDAQQDKTKPPEMRHLRESGAIEGDAYGILILHRSDVFADRDEDKDGEAVIAVRKIRQGGSTGMVPLKFTGPTVSFRDRSDQYADEFDGVGDGFADRSDLDL